MSDWAVLFDCDGVIVDSEPALAEISAKVLNKRGWPAIAEDFAPYIGTGEDIYIGKVVRKYNGIFDDQIKDEIYSTYVKEAADYVKGFEGGVDLIKKLQVEEIPAVVASSAASIKVNANLAAVGLTYGDFNAVISGDMVERKKPWPDIYLKAAEEAATPAERCIVVEDATAGIRSGVAAGMVCIGFTSNCTAEELLQAGAHYIAEDFKTIAAVISNLSGKSVHV